MKQALKLAVILLLAFLVLSPIGRVQGSTTVATDTANQRVAFTNQDLTFYFWYGPTPAQIYLSPTFAWIDNKQPSILYVVDLVGIAEFREPNSTRNDNAFQRNETFRNSTFSLLGNEAWKSINGTTLSGGYLNLILNTLSNSRASNFTYLSHNLALSAITYSTASSTTFFGYSYSTNQSRTDLYINMTKWRWAANNTLNNLALMFGFYALNMTVIQKLGIPLQDYVVPDFNFVSPEALKPRYAPFDPSAFLLTGMNLTTTNGATTPGAFHDLKQNETTIIPPIYEHKLNYTLPKNSTASIPFIKLQFDEANRTLPGYFAFPGFAIGTDNSGNKKATFNVTTSYISTGNYARIFLAYPFFGANRLRHFFSFGVDDTFLPAGPTPVGVYVILPSLPAQQALIIGGVALLSIALTVYVTRTIRRTGIESKR